MVAALYAAGLAACNVLVGHENIEYRDADTDGARDGSGGDSAVSPDAAADVTDAGGDAGGDSAADAPFDSGCGDTQTSNLNCGECGRSCNGAQCVGGSCVPQQLLTGLTNPIGITVLGGAMVWGEAGGELRTCSAEPPCTPARLLPSLAFPQLLNVTRDSTRVYWTNANDIKRCLPATECAGDSYQLAQTTRAVSGFFANDAVVLITTPVVPNGTDANIFLGRGFPLTPSPLTTHNQSPSPSAITLVGSDLAVWIAANGTRLDRCLLGTSACADAPSTLINGRTSAAALVGSGPHIYWTEGGATGKVLRCLTAGCAAPTDFASVPSAAGDIRVDGSKIYFAANGVWRCALSATTCTPLKLAASAGQPRALAFDATYVYWIEPSGIYRTPK